MAADPVADRGRHRRLTDGEVEGRHQLNAPPDEGEADLYLAPWQGQPAVRVAARRFFNSKASAGAATCMIPTVCAAALVEWLR